MAIDTTAKKLSLITYQQPFNTPIPISADGLGSDDKKHLIWEYAGLTWSAPAAVVKTSVPVEDIDVVLPSIADAAQQDELRRAFNRINNNFKNLMPIGTILIYNGSGIANVATRSIQLGDDGSDTISMAGWYVCNGNASTPNLLNKFIRSESASGNTGGEDTHTLTESEMPSHTHGYSNKSLYYDGASETPGRWSGAQNAGSGIKIIGDCPTIANTGGGSAHENKPAYYSLIFIIRMS